MKDPIVAEVRKHRQEHAEKFELDMKAICGDLRRLQEDCGHKVVSLKPQPLRARKAKSS